MKTIILNSLNIVPNSNNTRLRYKFLGGGIKLEEDHEFCLTALNIFYSWFNFNQQLYNNTVFSYTWIDGSVNTVTIQNSNLNITDLNAFFRSVMVSNTHYMETAGGDQVFFLEIQLNTSLYAVQVNALTVPTTAQATTLGYTLPSGATWSLPVSAVTPQFTVPSTNNFGLVIGFAPGTYPSSPSATNFSKTSDFSPQVSPVNSILVTLNIVNNDVANPDTLLYTFTFGGYGFGEVIAVQPPEFSWIQAKTGYYTELEVEFRDQNLNQIAIQDPQMTVILGLRRRRDFI